MQPSAHYGTYQSKKKDYKRKKCLPSIRDNEYSEEDRNEDYPTNDERIDFKTSGMNFPISSRMAYMRPP